MPTSFSPPVPTLRSSRALPTSGNSNASAVRSTDRSSTTSSVIWVPHRTSSCQHSRSGASIWWCSQSPRRCRRSRTSTPIWSPSPTIPSQRIDDEFNERPVGSLHEFSGFPEVVEWERQFLPEEEQDRYEGSLGDDWAPSDDARGGRTSPLRIDHRDQKAK